MPVRPVSSRRLLPLLLLAALALFFVSSVLATPRTPGGGQAGSGITGLFNTGLDNSGNPLADSASDPHYALVSTPGGAGGTAYVTQQHFPVGGGAWLDDSATSKWISPTADESTQPDPPGDYVYQTTFTVSGASSTARITGQVLGDNAVTSIVLNGQTVATNVTSSFQSWGSFTLSSGFVSGLNTLQFVVHNLPYANPNGTQNNPSGFRCEMTGSAMTPPAGSITSLFSTGLDSGGSPAPDGSTDVHYALASTPGGTAGTAYVTLQKSPIAAGAWMLDTSTSKWISPTADESTQPDPPGDYAYQTTFTVNGDPAAVSIAGQVAGDNAVTAIVLNGQTVATNVSGGFTSFSPFSINTGFVAGTNTLRFIVHNGPYANPDGSQNNPSGFRCEMTGSPVPNGPPPGAPTNLVATPGNGQVTLAWTASPDATGYNVKRSLTTGGPYTIMGRPASASYVDTGLTNGTTYYYVVTATNGNGESPNSNEASATPTASSGVSVQSLALTPTNVVGGDHASAVVTLSAPAPTGGVMVALQSADMATVPLSTSVMVAAGSRVSAALDVPTQAVTAVKQVSLQATYNGRASATLTVNPLLATLALSPSSVEGSTSATGTLTLNKAVTQDTVVALSSDNGAAHVPASGSVTVSSGQSSAQFPVTTDVVSANQTATLQATYAGQSVTGTLAVTLPLPTVPDVASITLDPASVTQDVNGQATSIATVKLTGPALLGGQIVTLASSNTAASVPAWLLVPANQDHATFVVTTTTITEQTTVDIAAAYAQNPPHVATLTVNPYYHASGGGPGGPGGPPEEAGGGSLGLTPAGIARGFALTTFASGFPNNGIGPIGLAYPGNAHVYVTCNGNLYDFPSDADGQIAQNISSYPSNGFSFASSDGNIYMTIDSSVVKLTNVTGGIQTTPIVTVGNYFRGMTANPANGHLFACDAGNSVVYEINPVAKTAQVFLTGLFDLDGISISADGRVIYLVAEGTGGSHIFGYDIRSHTLVFQSNVIPAADGCGVGHGALQGKIYVNTNDGKVYEVDTATGEQVVIASGGTRGDLTAVDPNGTLLLTQSDRVIRLVPPSGGSFADTSEVAATRDDLTNPTTTNYGPLSFSGAATSGTVTLPAAFDVSGLLGVVEFASMQRGGNVAWAAGTRFDMQWGLQSLSTTSFLTYGPVQNGVQAGTSPRNYTAYWDMPADVFGPFPTFWNLPSPFYQDIQASLGQIYQVGLHDQVSAANTGFSVTDTPQQTWPDLCGRNILSFTVYTGANPAIVQGRALAITLPGSDQPFEGAWDVVQNGEVVASSLNPAGWSVEPSYASAHSVWVTAPGSATSGAFYEVRGMRGVGSGYFDVTPFVTPPTSAPLLLPLSIQPGVVVGGNNAMGVVSLDAPAPAGGATVTLSSQGFGATVPPSVLIPVGQTSATYQIVTQPTTAVTSAQVYASYNGVRAANIVIIPTGGGSGPPGGGASLSLTAMGQTGQVTLNWSATASATGYNVKRSTAHGGLYTTIAGGVRATQYVDRHVVNGTTYYYVVSATNLYGEGVNSNEAAATPQANVPVQSLSVAPSSVLGGNLAIGTVTLGSTAPNGGASVNLYVSQTVSVASVPSQIVVPEGQSRADFVVTTFPVSSDTSVTLSATAGSTTSTATLTVLAPSLVSITLAPNPVVGGGGVLGTVTLNGDAGGNGTVIALSSNTMSVATLPSTSVTIPSGKRSATFTVNTTSVDSATSVAISATPTSGCDGTATANLQVNPANISCYIADLTLSNSCIIGAGTTQGTVTLSAPAPASGALVTLKSNNPNVTVPPSVTVQPGNTTAPFTITSNGVDDVTYVTISGSYNTWLQATTLTALPAGYDFTLQGLRATAGNGCMILDWKDFPDGAIRGYNVYRMVNGTPVLLNNTPLQSALYADTTVTNGVGYQYRVGVLNIQGQEVSLSVPISATPTTAAPTMQWVNTPGTATGYVSLKGTLSSGDYPAGVLLVDGNDIGPVNNLVSANGTEAAFDTSTLSNGMHTFQIAGYSGIWAYASSPLSIQINNAGGNFFPSSTVQPYQGKLMRLNASVPSNSRGWMIQIIRNENSQVVRTWQASSASVQLAWDGTDASGTLATHGSYSVQLTTQLGDGTTLQNSKSTYVLLSDPTALALVARCTPTVSTRWDEAYAQKIDKIFMQQYRQSGGTFIPCVLVDDFMRPRRNDEDRINYVQWLQSTVTNFVLYDHGNEPAAGEHPNAWFGGINFWAVYPVKPSLSAASVRRGTKRDIVVAPLVALRNGVTPELSPNPYNFVFIDTCYGAGGTKDVVPGLNGFLGSPGPVDLSWADAFQVGGSYLFQQSSFVGFSGTSVVCGTAFDSPSDWYNWRMDFWDRLSQGKYVLASANFANFRIPGYYQTPKEVKNGVMRLQVDGDTTLH